MARISNRAYFATLRRRENKRITAVNANKASLINKACDDPRPTPYISKRNLTKSQWERRMHDWCQELRGKEVLHPCDWDAAPMDPQAPLQQFRHCCWEDPRIYEYLRTVPPGFEDDVHIHTPRQETLTPTHGICYELACTASKTPPWHVVMDADAYPLGRLTQDKV